MPLALPAHFESHGTLTRVREDIDRLLPILISDLPDDFVLSLNNLIEKYAKENGWDLIVLDVSRGLARTILNDMTQIEVHAKNRIIIDPCGSTPEHTIVESEKQLKVNKERMIMANEATEDVLIILYGVDTINRSVELDLLKRHMQLIGISIDDLDDENEETIEDTIKRDELRRQRKKRMLDAQAALNAFTKAVQPTSETTEDRNSLFGADGALFMLYTTLMSLKYMPMTGAIESRLDFLIQQVGLVPDFFDNLEFDIDPYIDAALGIPQQETKFEQRFVRKQNRKKSLDFDAEPKLKKAMPHGPQLNPE